MRFHPLPPTPTGKFWKSCALIALSALFITIPVHADTTEEYGTQKPGESALIGMFYDLKQDQQHQPLALNYVQAIDDFISQGWDETKLDKYYRASRPLYTTQIFIPSIDASKGTEAFGVDKFVKPNWYLIHYKGQVVVPDDGTYRFVGYGDNVLIVAVDEKTVLVGNRADIVLPTVKWTSSGEGSQAYPDARLIGGDWLDLKKDQTINLDVLIGESSGGSSAFFLMIEKKGEHYTTDPTGHPILPIFQVAPYNTPSVPADRIAPQFAPPTTIWKCLQ